MKANFEARLAQMQRQEADSTREWQGKLQRALDDAKQQKAHLERELAGARRREEAAKDGEAEAQMARDDALALLGEARGQATSLALANERLKEKLHAAATAHEQELSSKASTLERWQQELRQAADGRAAALQRAERAEGKIAAIESRLVQLEQSNSSMDVSLAEARSGKDDFLYSVQRANERLKEKLRLAAEDRAMLQTELAQLKSVEGALGSSRQRTDEMMQRLKASEAELQRALRYKDDWMTEVKRRVALEEKTSAEAAALRGQLEQIRAKLSSLNDSTASARDVELRLANAEGRVSELELECQRHEKTIASLQRTIGAEEAKREETARLVERLQRDLSGTSEELRVARERLVVLSSLGSELSRLEDRHKRLQLELDAETAKSASFERAKVQLEKELAAYKASHHGELHGRVQDLLSTSGSTPATQMETSSSKHEALNSQLAAAQEEIQLLQQQVADSELEARESAETAKAWKDRYETTQQALTALEDDMRDLLETDAERASDKDELERRLGDLREEMNAEIERGREKEARIRVLDSMVESAKVKTARLEADLTELRRQVDAVGSIEAVSEWCAVLRALGRDDTEEVRRFLSGPPREGDLDGAVRTVASKALERPATQEPDPAFAAAKQDSPQALANNFKQILEDRAGVLFPVYKVIRVAPQAHPYGRTTFIQLDVGDGESLWLRVFETNGAPAILNCAQGPKDIREPIVYFDEWSLNFVEEVENELVEEEDEDEEEEEEEEEKEAVVDLDDFDDNDEEEKGDGVSSGKRQRERSPPVVRVIPDGNDEDEAPLETVEKKKRTSDRSRPDHLQAEPHIYELRSHDSESSTTARKKMVGGHAGDEAAGGSDAEHHRYNLRSYDHEEEEEEEPADADDENGRLASPIGKAQQKRVSGESSADSAVSTEKRPKRAKKGTTQKKVVSPKPVTTDTSPRPYGLRSASKKK